MNKKNRRFLAYAVLNGIVDDVEKRLFNDFEIEDKNSWETTDDQATIGYDIGYINGILYAIKTLKITEEKK